MTRLSLSRHAGLFGVCPERLRPVNPTCYAVYSVHMQKRMVDQFVTRDTEASDLKQIAGMVNGMTHTELKSAVLRLVEQDDQVRSAWLQLWKEKERRTRLQQNAVQWEFADFQEARTRLEPLIADKLEQCANLFVDRYEARYRRNSRYDYDYGRYDYTEGLEMLERWFAELQEQAADGEWVYASVGVLLTLACLMDWILENGDEGIGCEDLESDCAVFWQQAEALIVTIRESPVSAASKDAFLFDLIDWIAELGEEEEDWFRWTDVFQVCLVSLEHYRRMKGNLERLEPDLFSVKRNGNSVDGEVVRWWIQMSLDWEQEVEASRAENALSAFDPEASACFVRYYECKGRVEEAIVRLECIVEHAASFAERSAFRSRLPQTDRYFQWLIDLYGCAGREAEVKALRVRWFEAFPSLERFRLCLADAVPVERERLAANWIAHVVSRGRDLHHYLLIDMHLHMEDLEGAWATFAERNTGMPWTNDTTQKLFAAIKKHDPARLIPVFQQFAETKIAEKTRKSYESAAEWLVELKEVYLLMNRREAWVVYLEDLRDEHHRKTALQDEFDRVLDPPE